MHSLQLQAGYFIEELLPALTAGATAAGEGEQQVRDLLHWLSWFEVLSTKPFQPATPDYDSAPGTTSPHTIWTVATNLLLRGLPTRAPLELAAAALAAHWPGGENFVTASGETNFFAIERVEAGSLQFPLQELATPVGWPELLWRALHPLDPRLQGSLLIQQLKQWPMGSGAEADFATAILPTETARYLPQLLDPQTSLVELLSWSHLEEELLARREQVEGGDFAEQAADFTIALPYSWQPSNSQRTLTSSRAHWPASVRGIVLEVDGPHHKELTQQHKDAERDRAASRIGWQSIRVPVDNNFVLAKERLLPIQQLLQEHSYFQQLQSNYDDPLLATSAGRQALQLTLGPLAVARVQRLLLEVMQQGQDPLIWQGGNRVRVAIVERDVPCGQQAVEQLLLQLERLYALAGLEATVKLPRIDLHIFSAPEFEQPTLTHDLLASVTLKTGQPQATDGYELLFDVSMLQRPGFSSAVDLPGVQCLVIRTAHRPREARRFRSAPLIAYPALVNYDPARETYEPVGGQKERGKILVSFVQDIFRKRTLREGQLPIISRGLQGKNVLGLLPTGGGKSLTYQLVALLQPGVALVIDPIKSLMQDQVEGLMRNWIDAATFLNSSVAGRPRKEQRLNRLLAGERASKSVGQLGGNHLLA